MSDDGPGWLPTDPRAPAIAGAPAVRPGVILAGRWEVRAPIGRGGMATVYRAIDRELGEPVALKVFALDRADDAAVERVRAEVRLARRVAHPNVCRVHDLGDADGIRFLTMELIEGASLRVLLGRGKLSLARRLELVGQIASGVAAAHLAGVVHGDLKPENVLVRRTGHAVVADFGLARELGAVGGGERAGTRWYLPPERRAGAAPDARGDVYSLGLLFAELIGDVAPAPAVADRDVASTVASALPAAAARVLPPTEAAAVTAVIARAIAIDPAKRFADAAALGVAVERALGKKRMTAPPIHRELRRTRHLLRAALGASAVAIAVATWAAWPGSSSPRSRPPASTDTAIAIAIGTIDARGSDRSLAETAAAISHAIDAELRATPFVRIADRAETTWMASGGVWRTDDRLNAAVSLEGPVPAPPPIEVHAATAAELTTALRRRLAEELALAWRFEQRGRRAFAGTRSAVALEGLLAVYERLGPAQGPDELTARLTLVDQALAADPGYLPARIERANLLMLRAAAPPRDRATLDQSLAEIGAALAQAPDDPPALVLQCRLLQFVAEFDNAPLDRDLASADSACQRALERDPDSGFVHLALARLHDRHCRDDYALHALERAIDLDPTLRGRVLPQLVELAIDTGRPQVADGRSLELVAAADDEARLGERALARRAGQRAIVGAGVIRAGVLMRLGRTDDARAALDRELAATDVRLGESWVEAAALRGLVRAGGVLSAAQRDRLDAIEADTRAGPSADVLRLASGYYWTDPRRVAEWLARLGPASSCVDAVIRAYAHRAAGDHDGARRVIAACTPVEAWQKACVAVITSRR